MLWVSTAGMLKGLVRERIPEKLSSECCMQREIPGGSSECGGVSEAVATLTIVKKAIFS